VCSLLAFGLDFTETAETASPSIPTAEASMSCGQGTFMCGDLDNNGTCCWSDSQRCCYVPPSKGSCYCASRTDACGRY
jgi:hypothetical protein